MSTVSVTTHPNLMAKRAVHIDGVEVGGCSVHSARFSTATECWFYLKVGTRVTLEGAAVPAYAKTGWLFNGLADMRKRLPAVYAEYQRGEGK